MARQTPSRLHFGAEPRRTAAPVTGRGHLGGGARVPALPRSREDERQQLHVHPGKLGPEESRRGAGPGGSDTTNDAIVSASVPCGTCESATRRKSREQISLGRDPGAGSWGGRSEGDEV